MKIGDWIRRERRDKWHYVESVVDGDAVTHCGRRMTNEKTARGELIVYESSTGLIGDACRLCED